MNSVHDMGGSHGMGPVEPEADEPVFHDAWESRVLACQLAMNAWGAWNLDRVRWFRERVPGPKYLNSSYYEIWLDGLIGLIQETQLASEAEIASGVADSRQAKRTPALPPEKVVPTMLKGRSARRDDARCTARFAAGDRVRIRNIYTEEHTRLPRYARGRRGVVDQVCGVFVFPDSHSATGDESPQTVYSVALTAAELWGDSAPYPKDAVYLNLWQAYLEPA